MEKFDPAKGSPPVPEIRHQADRYYTLVRNLLYRTYMEYLDKLPVIPFKETSFGKRSGASVRILELTRIVYDGRANSLDDLLNVFSALGSNYGTALIVKSNGKQTSLYMGVRAYSQEHPASSGENLLKQTLSGHFSGTEFTPLRDDRITEVLDASTFLSRHHSWAIATAPGIPDLKSEEREHFTQGLERFIDAMQGKEYTAVILAEPVDSTQLLNIQTGYEQMASALSMYQKFQLSTGTNESEAVSTTMSNGFSETVSQSISLSQSHSEGTSSTISTGRSHSHTSSLGAALAPVVSLAGAAVGTLIAPGIGTMIGSQIGGALGGIASGVIGSNTDGTTTGEANGTSAQDTRGETRQEGTSKSTSFQKSEGSTRTVGSSRTIQLEQHNKSITRLVERIDQQLKRIDESRAFGSWHASCYVLASNSETASTAAAIFMGTLRGTDSGCEDSAIAVWNESAGNKRHQVLEYVENLVHPRLILGDDNSVSAPLVTPSSLITGKELSLLMNLPRKSVGGVTVLDGVGFGRERKTLNPNAQCEEPRTGETVHLGKVRHLFKDQSQEVSINLDNLVTHTLITGTTGAGKSTALKSILAQCYNLGVPFLVIEPAKNEYGCLTRIGNSERPVALLQAGRNGDDCLRLNPLVFPNNGTITVIEHIDRVCALFNAAFPMYAAMPQILEESLIKAYENLGWDLITSRTRGKAPKYPTLRQVADLVPEVVESAGYEREVKSTYIGALTTRLRSLTRGALGLTFMADASEETSSELLFDRPCIINLSTIGSPEKRAVLMGLLMIRLHEHRMEQGQQQHDRLKHLMVLEEAHTLLKKTTTVQSQETSNPQGQALEYFSNALAEMRSYGQGIVIVDQSVTALDTSVLRNTNTKIVFRSPFEDDRTVLGGALVLHDKQRDALARLESRTAIVKQNDWLEAIQCSIDAGKALELINDARPITAPKEDNEYARICRTVLLSTLLRERFPIGGAVPEVDCSLEEALKWLDTQTTSIDARKLFPSNGYPLHNTLDELIPALWSIPPLRIFIRSAFKCSVSDAGIINHLAIMVRAITVFEDPRAVAEVTHTLLRACRDEHADRVADLISDHRIERREM